MFNALPASIYALAALAPSAVPIRVNYDAPGSCPNQDAFYEAVRARTDRVRKAQGDEPRVDVNVRVTRGDRNFHGEMRQVVNQSETAARSVDGETCKDVVEALSLTVALSLDPEAHAPTPPEETPPAKEPSTPAVAATATPTAAPPVSVVNAAPLELRLGVSVLGTVVDTSAFSSGGALSVMLLREADANTSSAVQLSLLFASTGLPTSPDDHRTRFGALALDACPFRYRSGSFEIGPCALAAVGFLELTGRRLVEPLTVNRAWWSAGVDLQLSWRLGGGFLFDGALAGTVPLARHRYYTNSADQVVAETPVISPLVRAGLGYRF